jgi:co-chaperonin GroES (HSP10)
MIQPLHDRVLVERIPEPEGLIVIAEKYRDPSRMAKVVAVGPGRWIDGDFVRTAVKPGDVVHLPGIAAKIPDWDGSDGQILIQEGDIGAIVG